MSLFTFIAPVCPIVIPAAPANSAFGTTPAQRTTKSVSSSLPVEVLIIFAFSPSPVTSTRLSPVINSKFLSGIDSRLS